MAEFAHINLDDVWAGRVSARHARVCVEQQFENPRSRLYVLLRGWDRRFRDYSPAASVAMDTFDLIASFANGLGGDVPPYPRPGGSLPSAGGSPDVEDKRLFAPTVRDFNPDEFLRVLTGG